MHVHRTLNDAVYNKLSIDQIFRNFMNNSFFAQYMNNEFPVQLFVFEKFHAVKY